MARLVAELSLEQVDEFFTIGKTPKVDTTARSKSGGRALDPVTGKPTVHRPKTFIPPYRRHAWQHNPNQTAYASHYAQMEEEKLTKHLQAGSSRASTVSGMMEQLEIDSTITGISTVILPEGKSEEEANQVYQNYNFKPNYDEKLSITQYRREIIENIESNQAVVIHGPTGSGKTTQVPQYILDHYAATGRYCNIVVTQPRRIAAMSIANRVCYERGWQLSGICGYQVGMDRVASEDTRLLYCTTGILLEKLINTKTMQHYTHIILDEVHERDMETDFCLLVVRKLLHTNSRDVKVILMSATAESEKFARYFSLPIRGCLEPAPVIPVQGRTYKISEYFLNDLEPLGEIPYIDEDKPTITVEALNLTVQLILQFDKIESQTSGYSNDPVSRGTVLVFCPGLSDITDLMTKLDVHKERSKWLLIPLHSTITREEQAQAFNKPQPGQRKIIVSTNIAESSITVTDIKYVVDFCLTKNLVTDPETGFASLQVQWASKSNCVQRAGRAGRVSDGRVYKMVTRRFYREVIPDHGTPEMTRSPLDILVLKSKIMDMGEPEAILGLALDPPPRDNIGLTVLLLKEIGALVPVRHGEYNPHDGDLTFMGRVMASLPIDTRLGKLLILGHVFGVLDDCIIIASCLYTRSFFATPYKSYVKAYKKKLQWAENSFSDCIAYLNAYKTWQFKTETQAFSNFKQEREWGTNSFIEIKRIKEVAECVQDLTRRLGRRGIFTPKLPHGRKLNNLTPEQQQLLLKLVFCGAFYPNYFLQGHIDVEESNKAMSGRNPLTTVMVKGLPQNQGAIYRKQVESLFRHCENVPGARPKISFEETKAFIEFTRHPSDESSTSVIPPVYVAIKMRYLRIPLRIQLYESEVVNRRIQELSEMADEKARAESRLRTNRIKAVTDGAVAKTDKGLKQVDLPTSIQTIVPVYVTEVVNCGHFWGHYGDPDTWRGLCQLQQSINGYNGQNLKPMRSDFVSPGCLCLAPFVDNRVKQYYRARIKSVDKKNTGVFVTVFFLDYGNNDTCLINELRELDEEFQELPFQAVEWQLCGIKPSPIKCPNARWTQSAKDRFYNYVSFKDRLFAKVYSIVHDVIRVDLIEKIPGAPDSNICTRLINDNFADKCEESFLSKQSHEEREVEGRMVPRTESNPSTDFDRAEKYDKDAVISTNRSLRQIVSSKENWIEIPSQEDLIVTSNEARGRTINLSGPISMYEMKFYSVTAVGSLRETKIERDSINCVAVGDQTLDSHQRMMVAAYVGLNPTGTAVMARDTTILPLIPGLPGILSLVFCPFAEMRTDGNMERYTGALCGLGFSEETGGPVMADHDIEITFDTTFDEEDLKLINGVRMGIFIAIGSENGEWASESILRIQRSTQQKILSLVQKRREKVKPYYFPQQGEWNRVNPEDLLYPELTESMVPEGMKSQLSLHCGIALAEDDEDDEEIEAYIKNWTDRRNHVKTLHSLASGSTMKMHIHCELCSVDLLTPRELSMHLSLTTHKEKETIIEEHLQQIQQMD